MMFYQISKEFKICVFLICVLFSTNLLHGQITKDLVDKQLDVFYENLQFSELDVLTNEIFRSNTLLENSDSVLRDYLFLIEACRQKITASEYITGTPEMRVSVPTWLFPQKEFPEFYPANIDPERIQDMELRAAYIDRINRNELRLKNARFVGRVKLFITERAADFEWIIVVLNREGIMTFEQAIELVRQSRLLEIDKNDLITRIGSW